MMIYPIPWIELCLALEPTLIFLALYELVLVRPMRRRLREIDAACDSLERSTAEAQALGARMITAERRMRVQLSQFGERVGQVELRSDVRPYAQAISLAEQGERADRLISCFGLTEGEASLVWLPHGDRLLGDPSDETGAAG